MLAAGIVADNVVGTVVEGQIEPGLLVVPVVPVVLEEVVVVAVVAAVVAAAAVGSSSAVGMVSAIIVGD